MTPIETFRSWYLRQTKEVQESIGFAVLTRAPRLSENGRLESLLKPVELFVTYLDNVPDKTFDIIGEILLIRGIVDFSVMRQFGSENDWAGKKELNESVADTLEEEHGPNPMSDDLRQMLQKFPERQKMWTSTAQSWRILRNTELSDEVIEAWERDNGPEI